MIDDKDCPKTFEALEQYFTLKHGEYHIPLACVIYPGTSQSAHCH
jgi:hypothetical protein